MDIEPYSNTPKNDNKKIMYGCNICEKQFSQKSSLNRHIKEKHNTNKRPVCKFCGSPKTRIREHEKRCQLNLILANNTKFEGTKFNYIDKSIIKGESIIDGKKEHINDNVQKKSTIDNLNKLLDSLSEEQKEIEEISGYIIYKNIKIGEGGYSKVFYGIDKINKFEVAIKYEIKKKSLLCESLVLDHLKEIDNIPNKYSFITSKDNNILVQSIFGPTLKKIILYQKDYFDLFTVCEIGIQIISILIKIHSKNFVHNDIKPSNICWGKIQYGALIDKDKIFLIDYGLSKNISNSKDNTIQKVEYEDKIILYDLANKKKNYEGTAKYMAVKKAMGYNSSKQTDLEELFYTLIYLYKGTLPWEISENEEHKKHCIKVNTIKENYDIYELCKGLPEEFVVLLHYIKDIKQNEEPCYNAIIKLLESAKEKSGSEIIKANKFSFRKNINERFRKFKNKTLFDLSNEEIKEIFGEVPIDKDSLLD